MVQFGFGSRVVALVAASMMAGVSVAAVAKAPDPKSAESSSGDSYKSAAPERKARPTRYCVNVQPTTGTILSGRICKTREQWLEEGVDPTAPQK